MLCGAFFEWKVVLCAGVTITTLAHEPTTCAHGHHGAIVLCPNICRSGIGSTSATVCVTETVAATAGCKHATRTRTGVDTRGIVQHDVDFLRAMSSFAASATMFVWVF
jgi:hypothetical protein